MVDKGLDEDSCCLAIVGNHGMGDLDAMDILKSIGGFPKGKAQVDMVRQAKGHDVGVVLSELKGRCILG